MKMNGPVNKVAVHFAVTSKEGTDAEGTAGEAVYTFPIGKIPTPPDFRMAMSQVAANIEFSGLRFQTKREIFDHHTAHLTNSSTKFSLEGGEDFEPVENEENDAWEKMAMAFPNGGFSLMKSSFGGFEVRMFDAKGRCLTAHEGTSIDEAIDDCIATYRGAQAIEARANG